MAKRAHPEDDIQMAVAEHLRRRALPGVVWWHVANGGFRNAREAARLKKMGVLAGVADLILFHRKRLYALELKAPGGRPTEAQLAFLDAISAAGGFGCVCEGLDRSLAVLKAWGLIR